MSRTRTVLVSDSSISEADKKRKMRLQLKKVNKILRERLSQDGPGVAVLVMDKDYPVLLKGYGRSRIDESSRKITKDTVFDLASLSKQFTALGILMLIDQTTRRGPKRGKYDRLSFNTRLSRFFSDIPGARKIKIRNLLNHSSGLPQYYILKAGSDDKFKRYYHKEMLAVGDWYATMTRKRNYLKNEDVIELLKQGDLEFDPGTAFSYSNTGYVILAEIIKKITKKPLSQFLREEIFDRLHMHDTFVYDDQHKGFDSHALCYRKVGDEAPAKYESIGGNTIYNCIHGDGNVHSTVSDLAKWLKAWSKIDDHGYNRSRLIRRSTFLKTYKLGPSKMAWRSRSGRRRYNYRSGMFVYRYKNRNVNSYAIHHGGSWLGFNSYLLRAHVYPYRERRPYELTVVVLSNYNSDYEDENSPYNIGVEISKVYWPSGLERYNVLQYTI